VPMRKNCCALAAPTSATEATIGGGDCLESHGSSSEIDGHGGNAQTCRHGIAV
jgi:hypothetical protein